MTLQVGGGAQNLTVGATNKGFMPQDVQVTVNVPLTGDGVTVAAPNGCSGSGNLFTCDKNNVGKDETASWTFKLTPPAQSPLTPNDQRNGTGSVAPVPPAGGSQSFSLTLKGAAAPTTQAPQPVNEVSGTVVDSRTGEPIGEALVILMDSGTATEAKPYKTSTDSNGKFRFASGNAPITAGSISLGASKQGFKLIKTQTFQAKGGSSYTGIKLSMQADAAATASDDAMTLPDASATTEPGASIAAPNPASAGKATSSDSGLFSWVLYILGGLLFILGIVAIVLLLKRRNEGAGAAAGPAGVGAAAGAAGRGGNPYAGMPSNANDATQIVRSPLVGSGDPYGDPYGDPPPDPYRAPDDYPAAGGAYADSAAATQVWSTGGAAAGGYAGAAATGGGYRDPETAMYNGEDSYGGYGQSAAGGYSAGDHGEQGYGPGAHSDPAYGAQGAAGYGQGDDAYGGQGSAGYGGAHGNQGYDDSGYGARPAADPYAGGGYDDYDGRGGAGYGDTTRYAGGDGYARQGGHAAADPTGVFNGSYPSGAGYESGYDEAAGQGYDQHGGYDQQGHGQQGHGQQGGYAQQGHGQHGGYGQQGGYDQYQGYDQQGQGDGYDDEPTGSRRSAPPQQGRGQRVDWLDQ